MKAHAEDETPQPKVRIGPKELQRIVGTRKNLDASEALAGYAARYLTLGWLPVAYDAQAERLLDIDFHQPSDLWKQTLMDVAMQGTSLGLAIRLEAPLLVLKIKATAGGALRRALLESSPICMAAAGGVEHHFFLLPRGWEPTPEADRLAHGEWALLGPGEVVEVPPSPGGEAGEAWQWETAPWELPPTTPSEAILTQLAGLGALKPPGLGADLPTWDEIYAAIGHLDRLFKVLLAPCPSTGEYFRHILCEALQAGVTDPRLLKGLLWHAPHGDLPRHPQRARQLFEAVDNFPGLGGVKPRGRPTLVPPPATSTPPPGPPGHTPAELAQRVQFLSARTQELERQLAAMKTKSRAAAPPATGPSPEAAQAHTIPCWGEWRKLLPHPNPEAQMLDALRDLVAAFLAEHPDIGADPKKIHLLLYCYQHYVNNDPSNAGLSIQAKLDRALAVARDFIHNHGLFT